MKILFVQTSFIGDCILSTSTLGGIRRLYPQAEITVLTAPRGEEVFKANPYVAEVIVFDKAKAGVGIWALWKMAQVLKAGDFDVAYSLHRSWRTGLLLKIANIPRRIGFADSKGAFLYTEKRLRPKTVHEVLRNWALIEPEVLGRFDPCDLALQIGDLMTNPSHIWELSGRSASYFDSNGHEAVTPQDDRFCDKPIVAIAPGSAWRTKRYPSFLYRKVVSQLIEQGMRVAVIGGPTEVELCHAVTAGFKYPDLIDFSGRLSLRETFVIIASSKALVTNDSMALHVASAFKVPTVAIFCATSPSQGFGPWRNKATIVEAQGLWCRPCGRHGRSFCPTGSELCMHGIAPSRVVEAVKALLI